MKHPADYSNDEVSISGQGHMHGHVPWSWERVTVLSTGAAFCSTKLKLQPANF